MFKVIKEFLAGFPILPAIAPLPLPPPVLKIPVSLVDFLLDWRFGIQNARIPMPRIAIPSAIWEHFKQSLKASMPFNIYEFEGCPEEIKLVGFTFYPSTNPADQGRITGETTMAMKPKEPDADDMKGGKAKGGKPAPKPYPKGGKK